MQTEGVPGRRRALVSTGVALASCAALATIGSGVANAATRTKLAKPKVTEINWGTAPATLDQPAEPVELYTLHGAGGMKVQISSYGGDVHAIDVPDRSGKMRDVVLGFPNLADYVADFEQQADKTVFPISGGAGDVYFGGTIGRYANRIAGGRFTLNGQNYQLDINNGVNSLHGGYLGWNTHVWSGTPSTTKRLARVTLNASFPAGEGCDSALTATGATPCTGFPAPVDAQVTFTVQANNALRINYAVHNLSTTDATVVNVTNHSYFNLGGQASGTIYNQDLALNANAYQPTNSTQIPEAGTNGSYFQNIRGTAYDFLKMHAIGKNISNSRLPDGTSGPIRQLQYAHGYDNNWVLNDQDGKVREAAVAQDPSDGITMTTYTDQPGIQVYTSNYLVGDLVGTTGTAYRQGAAFTEETQHYPDSPNHIGQAGWPSVVLNAGSTFRTQTSYQFGIKPADYAKSVSFK